MDELNLSPVATEANVSEIQARAAALGLVVAVRCSHCGQPLFDPKSISLGIGPVCRAKMHNDPGANSAKNITRAAA
ncbi:DUF6011 domain-containing protein [Brevibacterium casei]